MIGTFCVGVLGGLPVRTVLLACIRPVQLPLCVHVTQNAHSTFAGATVRVLLRDDSQSHRHGLWRRLTAVLQHGQHSQNVGKFCTIVGRRVG